MSVNAYGSIRIELPIPVPDAFVKAMEAWEETQDFGPFTDDGFDTGDIYITLEGQNFDEDDIAESFEAIVEQFPDIEILICFHNEYSDPYTEDVYLGKDAELRNTFAIAHDAHLALQRLAERANINDVIGALFLDDHRRNLNNALQTLRTIDNNRKAYHD